MILSQFTQEERNLIDHLLLNTKREKWSDLARKFNIRPELDNQKRAKATNDIWRRFLKKIEKENFDLETVKQTYKNGELVFETKKRVIGEDPIDLSGFVINKVTTNPYGGSWKSYKKVVDVETSNYVFDRLFEKYKDFKLNIEYPNLPQTDDNIAILNLYDAHLDKIPVKSTTGVSSTLENNIKIFKATIQKIVPHIIYNNPEKIILPLGNDLFHTNGFDTKTKKGTQLEYFVNPEEAYYAICDVVIDTIMWLSTITKVEILMIKGNHDEDKITTLGYWLNRMFNDERVTIEHTRKQRKYIKYGENLLGFAHGDKEKGMIAKLPLIMAQEAKKEWGTTTYRKMYLGDLHHGFEYQFLKAKDQPGVEIEYLRSVGTTDTWHEDFGWIGVPKTAYLQIIDKKEGEFNRYKFNIK